MKHMKINFIFFFIMLFLFFMVNRTPVNIADWYRSPSTRSAMRTNAAAETQSLSHRITQWAKSNDWYRTDFQTNQLRLEQTFGFAVEQIAGDLEYHNQHRMSRRIFDLYDLMLAKCVKIDAVCRSGCRSEEELLELELLRVRVVGIACELAEALVLLGQNQDAAEITQTQCPARRRQNYRKASSALSQKEQQAWVSVHVGGKTITQTAIEFSCTPQNISKHLNNAQRKMKAQQSRSADTSHPLPEDSRGQVTVF
jgi:DNA-binding CsgD family transcriptional regulator